MIDIHAKNNVEWTDSHVEIFVKNGLKNITNVLVECKHLKFPTKERIEFAEKELAKLDKHKNQFLYSRNYKRKTQKKW